MDWIAHIDDFTGRLAALGDAHDPQTPVPTCGDWTLDDLLWHLVEVQSFWAHVIETRPSPPTGYSPLARPEPAQLPDGLRAACDRLRANLRPARAKDEAWSWSDDHTVGFTLRRQTHEALVHLVDGLIAVGEELPVVPATLAADGVDEILLVMLTDVPEWATFERGAGTIELSASDTGDRWRIGPGRISGMSPQTGQSVDEVCHTIVDSDPDTTVAAPALALGLWLWRRGPADSVDIQGDMSLASQLRQTSAIL